MITYLLKSGLCLALLLAFYHLILEREKMHRFNRFYLLGSVLFSFIVPLIIIYVEPSNSPFQEMQGTPLLINGTEGIKADASETSNIAIYFLTAYLTISGLFFIRFIKNLYHIIYKIHTNEVIKKKHANFIPVDDAILPHTFWNYIFINKSDFKKGAIEQELFTHELAHVTQRHTIDVLFIEIIQILFWFNPLFFVLKKAIQLNHEFLADDKVISAHNNISEYQSLLLNKAAWKNEYYLASNLNYSLTKKRLLMMKTSNSKASILIKKLALLPLLTGLVFLFADRVEAQTKKKKPEVVEIKVNAIATKAQMDEYRSYVKRIEASKVIKDKELAKMYAIYNSMSDPQKKSVKSVHNLVPPIPVIKKKTVSKTLFNKIKNGEKYAVWIDGKAINNKELNKHKHSDFVSYTGSFVHKNARSKRFPQEYQYTLYTQPYFEKVRARMKNRYGENLPPPPPLPEKINAKEVQKKIGKLPKPVKIEVIDRTKKGKKVMVREIPPKPVKIEVIKKGGKVEKIIVKELAPKPKKAKKGKNEIPPPPPKLKKRKKKHKEKEKEHEEQGELIEIIVESPEHEQEEEQEEQEEREIEELLELKELPEVSGLEKEEERELEEVQELINIKEISNIFETEVNDNTKVNYYYKGKKISKKRAHEILARHMKKNSNALKMKAIRDKKGNKNIYLND